MKGVFRLCLSLVVGCLVAVVVAGAAVLAARAAWPAYAAAEPHKAYTLAMLLARLGVAALSAAAAGCGATAAAGDKGRAAWWLGGVFLSVSIPPHLYPGFVWKDYPVWYHLTYLLLLVPVTGLGGRLYRREGGARISTPLQS